MHAYVKTVLIATTLITSVGLSTSAMALAPFQASYQFAYNGKNVGTATRVLQQQNHQQWTYTFSAKALGIGSASETSRFSFNNGQISSQSFSRSSKILVHNRTMSINFNPSSKLINTQKDKKTRSFAWQAGVLDELNAELQVREDLKKNALKAQYFIADAKEVEGRKFVRQGTEQIKTPAGTYNTVKVVMQHNGKNRQTVFWLAPQLDYLPVKVTHKDEDASYSLNLTKFSQ
ncbi:DUF3108 domain-containing protein [Moraxella sp. ZY210820]|uniref:DUF3108 domain-containing protein n=1 Tax=unclassified Moraxella TaxID=2685852 RepID=UPI002731F148|nr:DUF3108 domain-containing protein [Moraxella sp. ZY210820]WLF83832.1 DUF3108 domain-containing protein [Moraxella sp. ZY210820]